MILYLDTSALVKRYVAEPGSEEVTALVERADTVGTTVLAQMEMASALSKAARLRWIAPDEAGIAWQDFLFLAGDTGRKGASGRLRPCALGEGATNRHSHLA